MIHNKGYQTFDTVSSVVTTKVKGQGFVPINQTIDRKANKKDPEYYRNLFTIKKHLDYKIMDTAGMDVKSIVIKSFGSIDYFYFLHF